MMRKLLFIISVTCLLGSIAVKSALASSYVWEDRVNGFSISFPDSWQMQNADSPDTRIKISGPIDADLASCKVKATKDGRLKIYPKALMEQAVAETLNKDYWQEEINEYDDAALLEFYAPSNMGGQGDATAIKASYMQDDADNKKITMYAAMIGSIYGDTRYVVSCSSRIEEFDKYAPLFSSIINSIQLDKKYNPFAIGYYHRDFLHDPELVLPRSKPGTTDTRKKLPGGVWSLER